MPNEILSIDRIAQRDELLNRIALDFMRDEYETKRDAMYKWDLQHFLEKGIGYAFYQQAIADFAAAELPTRRFADIGTGLAQLPALLALRGLSAVGVDWGESRLESARRFHQRLNDAFPDIAGKVTWEIDWYPNGAKRYADQNTILIFTSISATHTSEQEQQMIDSLGLSGGAIINPDGFFRRRTSEEQMALAESIQARGFAQPRVVCAWDKPIAPFWFPGRMLYFARNN